MSTLNDIKEIARKAVVLAQKSGATTTEAHVNLSTDFEVEVRNGAVENLSEADSHSIYITISKNDRRASVSSCDFGDHALEKLIEQAMLLCKYTDQDPFYSLPPKELLASNLPGLDLFDDQIIEISPKQWIQQITELEDMAKAADRRLNSDGSFLGTNKSIFAMANSLDFCEGLETTSVSAGVSLYAEDNQGVNTGRKQSGGYSSFSCFAEDLEPPELIAKRAAQRVLRKLGAQKPKTGKFPVYFEPAMARKLWGTLLSGIKGSLVYRKETYLAGRLQKQIMGSNIYIQEDPFIKRAPGSRAFDSEGVQTRKRDLVTEGILQSYLLTSYSANKLNLQTTGHAGGYGNILVSPGAYSEESMLRDLGTGLWLTELSGQGVKLITGDYSRGASGLWIENGEIAFPVSEFTLSSNLDHMFNHIEMLGSNIEERYSIRAPGMVISDIALSGT